MQGTVPDEGNGFLQLYLLGGPPNHQGPDIGDELMGFLQGKAPWDSDLASEELEKHSELVAKIERIAAMPDASSANMPSEYVGFVSARSGKYAVDILLLKARIAAEAKDEVAALHNVRAALKIGDHYRCPDGGNLLCETVAILIDLGTRDMIFKTLLPSLGRDADLRAWKETMQGRAYTPAAFAKVIRHEWENSARYYLFPFILNREGTDVPKDGEALALAFTEDFNSQVIEIRKMDLKHLLRMDDERSLEKYANLSKESREISEIFLIGSRAWNRGYLRSATICKQYEAAMDLLILEQSGIVLDEDSSTSLAPDPLTDKPFVFDPSTRRLSAVESVSEVSPLQLPW